MTATPASARWVNAARRWLEARQSDLLRVAYYHVVFTLPAPDQRHRLLQRDRHLWPVV
jgi:hypothetical protein